MGSYVSSNEAIWRIFSFPNHERRHTVVHLAVHLENGPRVYFTTNYSTAVYNLDQFFFLSLSMRQNDDIARTLLYSESPKYYTYIQSSKKKINDGNNSRLYVACSRVGIPTKLFICAPEKIVRMYIKKH